MESELNLIIWLQNWFISQCDGYWEHDSGIKIETLDNPGWSVKINLEGTILENHEYDSDLIEISENNWYQIRIQNKQFEGFGDSLKLQFLLEEFVKIVDQNA